MPHFRSRHLTQVLERTLKFSPIVGLFGHRQVGKTTLAEKLSKAYVTFDRSITQIQAHDNPEAFIEEHCSQPLTIDECQLVPELFPALKEWVREHRRPGQFLLTGSVRFSSRKLIRESLTGRIISWELLPMDLSEKNHTPLPNNIIRFLKSETVGVSTNAAKYFSEAEYNRSFIQGGLPGIFAIRNESVRNQKFETQIEALLERDLRLLIQTSLDLKSLRNLLLVLSRQQGLPIEIQKISRATQISPPTLKKLLSALQSMFMIRVIYTEGTERKPIFFFEDQGEASHLSATEMDPLNKLTCFLFSNLRHQWFYRPEFPVEVFQFRNRGGALVPIALRSRSSVLGFIPLLSDTPNRQAIGSAISFLKTYINSKLLYVHLGSKNNVISASQRVIPLAHLV